MKFEIINLQICHVGYVVISATPTSLKHMYIQMSSLYKTNKNAVFITLIHLF